MLEKDCFLFRHTSYKNVLYQNLRVNDIFFGELKYKMV